MALTAEEARTLKRLVSQRRRDSAARMNSQNPLSEPEALARHIVREVFDEIAAEEAAARAPDAPDAKMAHHA
jgi:hypothetical protein